MNNSYSENNELLNRAIQTSLNARKSVIEMTHTSGASHVGSCLSVIDILSVLFVLKNYLPDEQTQVVLSKGHAAAALYAVLSEEGFLDGISLKDYCKNGSTIYGHVNHLASTAIPLSTGSLGHGMPFALGMAYGLKLKGISGRVFSVISDGECNEGTTWEAALVANQLNLNNLCVIIDRNRIQSLGDTEDVLRLEPLEPKWASFGWNVRRINGHDHKELIRVLSEETDSPICIIADTIKGKGISFMENKLEWHYRSPNEKELLQAFHELESEM